VLDLFDQVAQTFRRILCKAGLVVCRREAINADSILAELPFARCRREFTQALEPAFTVLAIQPSDVLA